MKLKTSFIEGVMPSIELKLFVNKKKYIKALKKCGIYDGVIGDAQVTPAVLPDGANVYFVYIHKPEKHGYEKVLALLAHEAVHISQFYFKDIGEQEIAMEEQAYVVQSICQCLFSEYRKYIEKKRKE